MNIKRRMELMMAVLLVMAAVLIPFIKYTAGEAEDSEGVIPAVLEMPEFSIDGTAPEGGDSITVVVDAGHGARDSGKVGVNGALEKDVNLAIAMKLKGLLEAQGIKVVMTRTDDEPLYGPNDSNHKQADMKKRVSIMEASQADLMVSIHQNSYGQETVRGPQVFYYANSAEGEKLAGYVQQGFDYAIGDKNTRMIKPNKEYYLLVHTTMPAVICECGFLSNWEEAELLLTEEYQQKIAQSIINGILEYLQTKK